MKIIITKNKETNQTLPLLNLINNVEQTRKEIKKQLIKQIIDNPESLKAYKNLEILETGEANEQMKITAYEEPKPLFTYKEILEEIIEQLTKEGD